MASPFDRLMETARPNLPGAIDVAMQQELFAVCQEFFRESCVWQEDLGFPLAEGSEEGEITPYTGRLERLLYVKNDTTLLPFVGATMPDPDLGIVLMPKASAGNYTATVVMNVSDPVSRAVFPIAPVDVINRYWQVIMHGLFAHLMAQPSKPFSNLQLAAIYQSKFQGGIARARQAKKTLYTQGAQAWKFPQSFNNHKTRR